MLTTQWQTFLATQSPSSIADNTSIDLNAQLAQSVLLNITHSGVLTVTGEDASRFLQGQTTCDMRLIDTSTSALGACCTPKGRVFANFRIVKINDAFHLQMDESITESTKTALDKYIRFFKARMTNESGEWIRFGVKGTQAETALKKYFTNIPDDLNQVTAIDAGVIVRLPHTSTCFEIWLKDLTAAVNCWQALAAELTLTHSSAWNLLAIRAGMAVITSKTVEAFTPHMINYQAVGGISFTKGCYTGQEIVARTHYLGKLKKHLYHFNMHTDQLPAIGSIVTTVNGENVGEVVNAVQINQTEAELLAVVQQQSLNEGNLLIDGKPAELLTLPYSFENE